MTQNKKHSYPYRNTPPQTHRAPAVPTDADKAMFARFSACVFLKKHIGGEWRWNEREHTLNAEFVPAIAGQIADFMKPLGILPRSEPTATTEQTRLSLTIGDFNMLERNKARFGAHDKPLAVQYGKMLKLAGRAA